MEGHRERELGSGQACGKRQRMPIAIGSHKGKLLANGMTWTGGACWNMRVGWLKRVLSDGATAVCSAGWLFLGKIGLRAKSPYQVILKGEPLWWTGAGGRPEEIGGFYTTRWVMAWSSSEAIIRATAIVMKQTGKFARNPAHMPIRIELDHCMQLRRCLTTVGRSFTFWNNKDEDPDGGIVAH